MFKVKPRATLGQGWPKPGTQGTDKSQRILANLDKTERTGRNGLKTGIFRQKRGKNWAKPGKKRANETEPWQNRAKPKVSPNLGSVLVIPVMCYHASFSSAESDIHGSSVLQQYKFGWH